jgi:hypothetical protein
MSRRVDGERRAVVEQIVRACERAERLPVVIWLEEACAACRKLRGQDVGVRIFGISRAANLLRVVVHKKDSFRKGGGIANVVYVERVPRTLSDWTGRHSSVTHPSADGCTSHSRRLRG